MPLLTLDQISLSYGPQVLLDQVELKLFRGDKIGLLGRNGAGKSTLLKLLQQQIHADSGTYWLRPGTSVAVLDQELPATSDQTVRSYVTSGLAQVVSLLARFEELSHNATDASALKEMEIVQHQIEAQDGWSLQQRVESVISHLQLPADKTMAQLSGGWRRRVALAKALVTQPDILLLDEPTNHLDIPAIEWLEKYLSEFSGAVILITHDRAFLQRTTNKIIELDRGYLRSWDGDYRGFLSFQAEQLAAEETANALFDKRLAEEEKWIRQGIKARRTRNEGRVRALKAMREEYANRRNRQGNADFAVEQAGLSGKIVVEAKNIRHGFADQQPLINNFSTLVMRGDKIGLVGVNGCGKSTLLKILLGELKPQQGSVKLGTKLEIAYFDQLRGQLDGDKSVIDNLSEGRDFIEINGKNRHIISYLQDFLFPPDRCRQPVRALSGGEQNRLILAKLFSKPANVLVLDEPTNDLDLETLELLEEILLGFDGTLLLVSHDREFLDNVVARTIVFEGDGVVNEYVGGFSDWEAKGGKLPDASDTTSRAKKSATTTSDTASAAKPAAKAKKLSYKLQRELEQLPQEIERLESEIEALQSAMADPQFYSGDKANIDYTLAKLADTQGALDKKYARWQELEEDM